MVNALATYGGALVAAGMFDHSGSSTVGLANVARWNGSAWGPLGAGLGPGQAMALAVYNGALVAGGDPFVSSWSGGAAWTSLGGTNGIVYAFAMYNGALIVGRLVHTRRRRCYKDVAQWSGGVWRALGPGMSNWVAALTVFEGALVVGGLLYQGGRRARGPDR